MRCKGVKESELSMEPHHLQSVRSVELSQKNGCPVCESHLVFLVRSGDRRGAVHTEEACVSCGPNFHRQTNRI